MNIYVETNFVLELALLQEQYRSCEDVLALCEAQRAQLVVPAYALVEPHETLVRRHQLRKRMKRDLDVELRLLGRTATYAQRLDDFRSVTSLLLDSSAEEARRLQGTISRMIEIAQVVPVDTSLLMSASENQVSHSLAPQDALILASVLHHLRQSTAKISCFLNRNTKDFEDPDIIKKLARYNCKLLPRFDSGFRFVLAHVA